MVCIKAKAEELAGRFLTIGQVLQDLDSYDGNPQDFEDAADPIEAVALLLSWQQAIQDVKGAEDRAERFENA